MTATELMELFESMDNSEKLKFLELIGDKHFPHHPMSREELIEMAHEILDDLEGEPW